MLRLLQNGMCIEGIDLSVMWIVAIEQIRIRAASITSSVID